MSHCISQCYQTPLTIHTKPSTYMHDIYMPSANQIVKYGKYRRHNNQTIDQSNNPPRLYIINLQTQWETNQSIESIDWHMNLYIWRQTLSTFHHNRIRFHRYTLPWQRLWEDCIIIWARSRNWGCLVTWFCYQLIAKPGNKTATVSWPGPYAVDILKWIPG